MGERGEEAKEKSGGCVMAVGGIDAPGRTNNKKSSWSFCCQHFNRPCSLLDCAV